MGAGNGGCAAAADLTRRGFEVRLYNRTSERLRPIQEQGGIELSGEAGDGLVKIAMVTDRLEEAVAGADLLLVTVPTSALTHYAAALAPLVTPEQTVMLNPGHMGGSLYFAAEVKRLAGKTGLKLCETTTLPYACRMQRPAAVRIFRISTNLLFAAFPSSRLDELYAVISPLFPQIKKARTVMETGLQDLNAVEHPAQILCNAGWIEFTQGNYYFYYEGTTPAVARVIEAVDAERVALARAMDVPTKTFVDYFYDAGYTSRRGLESGRVYEAMQDSEANRWIKGPKNLDHRYVHEDVGWGLVPWMQLADRVNVAVPTMHALTELASIVNGIDYRITGLTLERMGLAGMDKAQLDNYLATGVAS